VSLRTKAREQAYELHLYRGGRCPVEGLRGLLHAWENVQGHSVSLPDLKFAFFPAQNATPAAATVTGPGRLYGIWVLSGSLSAAGIATSTPAVLDSIVRITDNSVVFASVRVRANKAAEVYFFDSGDGVGDAFTTNIQVSAVAASGSGNPNTADLPDIVLLYGDDATNTADSNVINVNYG